MGVRPLQCDQFHITIVTLPFKVVTEFETMQQAEGSRR